MFERTSSTVLRYTIVALAVFGVALSGCRSSPPPPTATLPPPEVTLVVNPEVPEVIAGESVALTAKASGQNLSFNWLVSRGKLSALDTPSVIYTAPDTPGVDTVTVEVSGASGMTVESVGFEIVAPSPTIPTSAVARTPTPMVGEVKGRVCQYKEDFSALGDRLFLRTAEFNRLGLPIGTQVTVDITIDGTPHQVSGLILDHDEGMLECTFRLNKPTREALGVDDDVRIKKVKDRPIRDFQITVESVPAPSPASKSFEGRVCQYKEDFLTLGDRLFLRTAEFNRLGLPIGTRVTVAITVNGTPHQVSGLILDHDEGMLECTVRLPRGMRIVLGVNDDVGIVEISNHPIREFQIAVEP